MLEQMVIVLARGELGYDEEVSSLVDSVEVFMEDFGECVFLVLG